MKQVELKPIRENLSDYDEIEARIIEFLKKELYAPLLSIMNQKTEILQNSMNDLLDAIKYGRIWFYRGQFKGRFNSRVSKELKLLGARWDRRQGLFKVPHSALPDEVRNAIVLSEEKFKQTAYRIDKRLSEMSPESIADKMKLEDLFDSNLWKVHKKIEESVKGITVMPDLSASAREKIAKDYTNNMKLYIKEWTEKEIQTLRKTVKGKVFSGLRYEDIMKSIQRSYNVSQTKAKFLARQETSILMSKFKESRYQDIGSQKYKWSCVKGSPNHPVRPMHKIHDQKIFLWKSPPVINNKGDRKNPGMDYGCRCTAIPIITF